MSEVLEISDDEDSFELEDDVGIIPKDEEINDDMPPPNMYSRTGVDDVASSSGTNLRSSFIGMGFAPSLVDKAIEENGEGNHESVLETLFAYSDLQRLKTEIFDGAFSGGNDNLAANLHNKKASHEPESHSLFGEDTNSNVHCNGNIPLKVEYDVGSEASDEKIATLLKMTFTSDEIGFAMRRLGQHASIGQLMDFIFAARMAKKYEKDPNNSFLRNEETEKDSSNEALFGIMEKTLQLLEMGFSENGISAAFAKCGSKASVTELADFIVAAGTGPNADKYLSTILSEPSVQRDSQSLKRRTGDWDSLCIKIEEGTSDVVSQDDTSEKLEGWMPKEIHTYEPSNWKIPKEEFMEEPSSSVGGTVLDAKRRKSSSKSNPLAAPQRQIRRTTSFEEDIKPTMSLYNSCRSISSVVAEPPYFLYGNVTKLTHNSWVKISQFMYSVQPEFARSNLYSALNRVEGYIHNLPTEDRFHISPKGPMTIQEAVPHTKKWWPLWDDRKHLNYINYEMTGITHLCDGLGRMMADCRGPPPTELQSEVLQHCETNNLVWVGKDKLAPLELEHVERIMGYPLHHSQVAGFSSTERLKALKLSFQTDTLGYHLSPLRHLFPDGVTILSFFDGIGGVEVALHRLGIRLKGVVSVEPSETKRRILKKWWDNSAQRGELIQLEGTNKLSRNKLEDLFKKFKGFNLIVCQNPYTGVESDSLDGLDFSMFVEFVRVLQRVRSMNRN